jgi:hypothetical protein
MMVMMSVLGSTRSRRKRYATCPFSPTASGSAGDVPQDATVH